MFERPEYAPGTPAPSAGAYEQINIFGQPTGICINIARGHPLPRAPIGHWWRALEADGPPGEAPPIREVRYAIAG